MASQPSHLRALQAIGLTATSGLAAYSLSLSTAVIPRLLESPTPLLLKQFVNTTKHGHGTVPTTMLFCSSVFVFLAFSSHRLEAHRHVVRGYIGAAILPILIVPYTLFLMQPTNRKLFAKAEDTKTLAITDSVVEVGLGGETAHALVDHWGVLNLGRAALIGAGALIGTFTALMHDI